MLNHSNKNCFFKRKFRLYLDRTFLANWENLQSVEKSHGPCSCYDFAYLDQSPTYVNYEVEEEEYQSLMDDSLSWHHKRTTPYKYNLGRGNKTAIFRDPFVTEAIKSFDKPYYYELCDKNKTPRKGRMFRSLLTYLYPTASKPKSNNFLKSYELAKKYVLQNIPTGFKPLTVFEAMNKMPGNTSAGFTYLKHGYKQSMKKSEVRNEIFRDYLENRKNILNKREVNDYCMFAMRGHLSDRLKNKTRPVWLVSSSTILAETRFYQPLYDHLNNDNFFLKRMISGKGSLPRLRKYLTYDPNLRFYNTDISAWDSFRASWFHEDIMKSVLAKFDLDWKDKLEANYCIQSAIRTQVLFPNGEVYQKHAGIISGTTGTLLFNTLLNMIASYTILHLMKMFSLSEEDDFVTKIQWPNWLGDDFAFYIDRHYSYDLKKFASLMYHYFCIKVNDDKTIVTDEMDDRKFLGYQLKGGLLFREEKELFQSVLYTERSFTKDEGFSVSFSRFFSYLLLGGINNYRFVDFFYFFLGKFEKELLAADTLYNSRLENIFKLLKDIYNVNIPSFNLETFKQISLHSLKYVLLYNYDFKFSDLF